MNFVPTQLPGVVILVPEIFSDARGYLFEAYHRRKFAEAGIDASFVQDTQSRSLFGVIRGLHAQRLSPQAKLIRVLHGTIFDVAVDIRRGSPTFARWVAIELSAENRRMCFIPRDYAHGFCVTSDYAEVEYKTSDFYQPSDEIRIAWNDPAIGIKWPTNSPILSDADAHACTLEALVDQLPTFERPPRGAGRKISD